MKTPTKTTKRSVYNLNYHIVLVTKFRNKVLKDDIEAYVKNEVSKICAKYDWEVLALEVMPEHVHLFVPAPPTVAPVTINSTVKSILAVGIFKAFPTLKSKRFWGSGLWSDGTYYGSAGSMSAEIIKRYIENQKTA